MISDREALLEIYHGKQKELMLARVQEFLYQREYANPKKIGKSQAEEGIAIYQKNMKHLREQLTAIEGFAETLKLRL